MCVCVCIHIYIYIYIYIYIFIFIFIFIFMYICIISFEGRRAKMDLNMEITSNQLCSPRRGDCLLFVTRSWLLFSKISALEKHFDFVFRWKMLSVFCSYN